MEHVWHQVPAILAILAVTARFEAALRNIQEQHAKQTAAYMGSIENIVQKYGSVVRMVTESKAPTGH